MFRPLGVSRIDMCGKMTFQFETFLTIRTFEVLHFRVRYHMLLKAASVITLIITEVTRKFLLNRPIYMLSFHVLLKFVTVGKHLVAEWTSKDVACKKYPF